MIELVVNIPDRKQSLVEQLIAELGGEVTLVQKEKKHKPINSTPAKSKSVKIKTGKASDHTYLFDKWKDYEIDVAKIRDESW
jgi:hypothetical protein